MVVSGRLHLIATTGDCENLLQSPRGFIIFSVVERGRTGVMARKVGRGRNGVRERKRRRKNSSQVFFIGAEKGGRSVSKRAREHSISWTIKLLKASDGGRELVNIPQANTESTLCSGDGQTLP